MLTAIITTTISSIIIVGTVIINVEVSSIGKVRVLQSSFACYVKTTTATLKKYILIFNLYVYECFCLHVRMYIARRGSWIL